MSIAPCTHFLFLTVSLSLFPLCLPICLSLYFSLWVLYYACMKNQRVITSGLAIKNSHSPAYYYKADYCIDTLQSIYLVAMSPLPPPSSNYNFNHKYKWCNNYLLANLKELLWLSVYILLIVRFLWKPANQTADWLWNSLLVVHAHRGRSLLTGKEFPTSSQLCILTLDREFPTSFPNYYQLML